MIKGFCRELKDEILKIEDLTEKGLWLQTSQETGVFDIIDKLEKKYSQTTGNQPIKENFNKKESN